MFADSRVEGGEALLEGRGPPSEQRTQVIQLVRDERVGVAPSAVHARDQRFDIFRPRRRERIGELGRHILFLRVDRSVG